MQLSEESICFKVNDKPTTLSIEGSHNSGFMYSVRWFDANFVRDLECASLMFNKDIMKDMVLLANKIDKSVS